MKSNANLRDLYERAKRLPKPARAELVAQSALAPEQKLVLERMLQSVDTSTSDVADPEEEQDDEVIDSLAGNLDANMTELLDQSWTDVAAKLRLDVQEVEWIGREIGGFVLRSAIGSGGSSWVFSATRTQAGVQQNVALKLFRRVLIEPSELRRFHRERQMLMRLEHPGIARYIDGGATPEGLAYIVMELVDGEFLTNRAQRLQWSVPERLAAFLKVCQAVEFAHQALIVHRDIKPANVLITSNGEVKLLDFGIAKFLGNSDQSTETQNILLTPAYAAPEQFTGAMISTQTDVYSLGLLLSELLTSRTQATIRVFKPQAIAPHTIIAPSLLVQSNTGHQPTTEQTKLARLLRGDLDTIVLKATSAEPRLRYSHADALAQDIQRYLDHQPIQARRPSAWYVANKFVRRHALACALVAFTVLAISISALVAWQQAYVAKVQAQRAESTQQFLIDVFKSAEPSEPGRKQTTVAEVTQQAIQELQRSQNLIPEVKATLLIELAAVLRGQGDADSAIEVLQKLRAELPAHATTLRAQTDIQLVNSFFAERQESKSALLLDELETMTPVLPVNDQVQIKILRSKWHYFMGHDSSIGLAITQGAISQCAQTQACRAPLHIELLREHARIQAENAQYPAATESYQRALQLTRQSMGAQHVLMADVLAEYANTLRQMNRKAEAEQMAQSALDIYRAVLSDKHWRLVDALGYLGAIQFELSKYQLAYKNQKQALALARELANGDSDGLVVLLSNLGYSAARLGRFSEAKALQQEAFGIVSKPDAMSPGMVGILRCRLGLAMAMNAELEAGLSLCEQAIAELRDGDQASQNRLIEFQRDRGLILQWLGRHAESVVAIEASIRQFDQKSNTQSPALRQRLASALLNAKWLAGELSTDSEANIETSIRDAQMQEIGFGPQIDLYLCLAEARAKRLGSPASKADQIWQQAMQKVTDLAQKQALVPFQQQRFAAQKSQQSN